MAEMIKVDLFCEDSGHERFVDPLIRRIAGEQGRDLDLTVQSARGGRGRAVAEFRGYQKSFQRIGRVAPDLLVLVVDGNCSGWNEAHATLVSRVDSTVFPRSVVGCPDPHVERWCLADKTAYTDVVGIAPPRNPGKCERDLYKRLLTQSMKAAGQVVLADPMDFAPDLVARMDLYRAGKAQTSLGHLVDDLRQAMQP